jgi:hypothetical protein
MRLWVANLLMLERPCEPQPMQAWRSLPLGLRDEVMAGNPAQPANASAPADPDARRKFLLENIVLIL